MAVARGLGADDRAFWIDDRGGSLYTQGPSGISARFSESSVAVGAGGSGLRLGLRAIGRSNAVRASSAAAPRVRQNLVTYARGPLVEWYANGPLGLEQGFTVHTRPAGSGLLRLVVGAVPGGIRGRLSGAANNLSVGALDYGDVSASDARGQDLPVHLGLSGRLITLSVDDAGARYPIVVDPIVQRAELTSTEPGGFEQSLGSSIATSSSGATIAVGAPGLSPGANGGVYVFTKPPSGWANATQTALLTASDAIENDQLGASVAISSNGKTIVAGAPNKNGSGGQFEGEAYVFTQPAAGWTNETEAARLTPADGQPSWAFGESVTMVPGGRTIAVGAPGASIGGNSSKGAVYVFTEPKAGWTSETQAAELTATDGAVDSALGTSVAIRGGTIAAGARGQTLGANQDQGAVYVYQKHSRWKSATQTAELTASDGGGFNYLGTSVALAKDTIVAGAPVHSAPGAAYVFVEPAGGWANGTQAAKLTASDAATEDDLGMSVGVISNAKTIVAGAPAATIGSNTNQGAAYIFQRLASGWTSETQNAKITNPDGTQDSYFGQSVSTIGTTIAAGAPGQPPNDEGASYVFLGKP